MAIERTFGQLGMLSPGSLTQERRVGLQPWSQSGAVTQSRGLEPWSTATSTAPARLAPFLRDTPQAIEKHGPLAQFLYGTGSPVLSTLARMGVIEARPDPVTLGETIARMGGTLLGWTALLKFTGLGAGLAAAGGAAAKGLGLGTSAAARMITTSSMYGATFGAHSAWTERKPMGPEMMKSMAFAAGIGAAGAGIGHFARKMKMLKLSTAEVLKQEKFKMQPLLNTQDEQSVLKAIYDIPEKKVVNVMRDITRRIAERKEPLPSKFRYGDAGLRAGSAFDNKPAHEKAKILLNAFRDSPDKDTLFEPLYDLARVGSMGKLLNRGRVGASREVVRSIVKATDKAEFDVEPGLLKSLSKKQQVFVNKLKASRTLGEQEDHIRGLFSSIRGANRQLLKNNAVKNYEQLAAKKGVKLSTLQKYADREALKQDLTWQLGNRVSKVVGGEVNLPSLTAINEPQTARTVWASLKDELSRGRDLDNMVEWHPKMRELFRTLNKQYGMSYSNTTFMPKAARTRVDALIKQIEASGDSVRTLHYDLLSYPVPAHLAKKDIPKWIMAAKEPPAALTYMPHNLQEAITLQRDIMPIFGRFLTPVRHALGDSFATTARSRVHSHKQFMNDSMKKINTWYKYLGVKPGKEARDAGVRLGAAAEGRIPEETRGIFESVSKRLSGYAQYPRGKAVEQMAKQTGVPKAEIQKIHRAVTKTFKDKTIVEELKKIGVSKEEYIAQHLMTQRLYRAGTLTGEAAEQAAKSFGLKNVKELKVLYQMRREMDKVFRKAGIDPERYIAGYLPRFAQMDNKSFNQVYTSFKQMGLKDADIKRYMWANELSREGQRYTYEQDAFKAFSRYLTGFSKKENFNTLFEQWDKRFKKMGLPEKRKQLYEDLKAWMVGKPGEVEREMDSLIYRMGGELNKAGWNKAWGARPTAEISEFLAELQYMGGIGFNPFTAVKNLTQKGLALTSITDDGNPLHGLKWMMKARQMKKTPYGKFVMNHNKIIHNRQFMEGLDAQQSSITRFLRNVGVPDPVATASDKVRKSAFHMFRKSDISNVEDTFMAKFLYLTEAKKAPLADAVNLATQTTMATQFMYGFDSPMLYKSPIGRQMGIFMSWPINWAHLMYTQGTSGDAHRAIATVGMFALGSEVLSLTGFNFRSIHPVNTARGILPLAMAEGEDKWPIALRSAAAVRDTIRALSEGDPIATDAAFDRLKQRLRPMVPAGIIGGRVLDFIDVAKHDWKKYDQRDRLRYESSPGEAFRSILGPTTEAKERFETWQQVSRMDSYYRRMRGMAVDAFMSGDYGEFDKLQEQLVVNFGRWIEPQDIRREAELREMSARERQLIGVPASLRDPFLERYGR